MRMRPIYMKLDTAHAGIPAYIADTPTELAKRCGVTLYAVLHGLQKARETPDGKSSYATVWTEWSDEEYQAYFGKEAKTS